MARNNVFLGVGTRQVQADSASVSSQNCQTFEEIVLNKKLTEEMFSPD